MDMVETLKQAGDRLAGIVIAILHPAEMDCPTKGECEAALKAFDRAALARPPVAPDVEVAEAARRLLRECEVHDETFGPDDSLVSFEQDIIVVARAALARDERESKLRAALLALSGGGLSAPCWCGRLPHTPECDQAREALTASGTPPRPEHLFLPRSGSQDASGQYRRCSVNGCDLAPDQHVHATEPAP